MKRVGEKGNQEENRVVILWSIGYIRRATHMGMSQNGGPTFGTGHQEATHAIFEDRFFKNTLASGDSPLRAA